ncbi:hypothetical protein CAC42_2847 [Sphaceloma murrayae]|uniref:Glycosylphosphatidylinositol anchor biosynthesis protein 11 n=1 Tax=Sphaceloma murrayae TaxID=2082308 RepID=A0A2K1R0V9_9PEZI|nr:hypothetical protein CAC42_2847 [Sphaceloma murrayae]
MAPKEANPSTPAATVARPMQAVDINDEPLSKAYSYIHIAAVLSTFIYTFPQLVADPITTMTGSLLPLALLQGLYCAICLPSSPPSAGKKKKPATDQGIGFKIVPSLLSLSLCLLLGAPLLTVLLLLFGAPFTTHQLHTLLCAAHIALLAGPQLVYVHGVAADRWLSIAGLDTPIDEVFGASLGACMGAWVGAVPIPLDWDREWQRWPVTILAGGYGGWALGRVVGATVGKGRRIRLD